LGKDGTAVKEVLCCCTVNRFAGAYSVAVVSIAYLRDANTPKSVTDTFEMLYRVFGEKIFKELFSVSIHTKEKS